MSVFTKSIMTIFYSDGLLMYKGLLILILVFLSFWFADAFVHAWFCCNIFFHFDVYIS